jgi:ubiquinol-cytochrome c reductase cytochrome b subunit
VIGIHLYYLHNVGSTNPLGIGPSLDKVRFYPKYIGKDIAGCMVGLGLLYLSFLLYAPEIITSILNYLEADFLSTPKHIAPEWYFLPFYGILRSIPNKVHGVFNMLAAIGYLVLMPLYRFRGKSSNFCFLSQFIF